MPNIYPAHLRRAFRRAVRDAEVEATLAAEEARLPPPPPRNPIRKVARVVLIPTTNTNQIKPTNPPTNQ